MTDQPAIDVAGVGKRYVKYEDTPMLVSRLFRFRNQSRRSSLWALRGATFRVERGECIGVVGRNGSGKSTLLQMLAGVTAPTEGVVSVRGRVAPLISVGVGFHPELTGRENVYVNATILGLTRAEIDQRLDEIVDFADIGDFLDTPVKFYSSGMFVRLGFSVSAIAEPDVMLIDEVLAVGDFAFQLKCFDRLERLRAAGATVVIVTHNLGAVRRLCERTLVVHGGALRYDGATVDALSRYHELLSEPRDAEDDGLVPDDSVPVTRAVIEDAQIVDADGGVTHHFAAGDQLFIEATIRLLEPVDDPIVAIGIVTEGGVSAFSQSWPVETFPPVDESGRRRVRIAVKTDLATGSYSLRFAVASHAEPQIAWPPPPLVFFVTGRLGVRGIADLDARVLPPVD